MLPAISQVCSLSASFETDLADYAAGACAAVEIWLGKLETFLDKHSVAHARRLLDEHHLTAPVASFQGGLLTSQGEFRQAHWESFQRRLRLCQELEIGVLVVAADVGGALDAVDIDRARMSLAQMAQEGAAHGRKIALEFQARASFINNLQTAVALIEEVGHPSLGLCLDLFHFAVGPSKTEDLAYLTRKNLFHVQLCDLSGVARELAVDADRILPGDGDLGPWIEPLVAHLRDIEYTGYVALELMNPRIWSIPPRQLGEVGMTALRKILGLASMG